MGVNEKLLAVQTELKAPKNQYNSFGKYKYRSCEDILEGVKPVLAKNKATLVVSDDIVLVGERYYVKAMAEFIDIETGDSVKNVAFARESDNKKGMDEAQVTGATSSYARKYALNGLFLIDDTKDADTDEYANQQNRPAKKNPKAESKTDEQKNAEMVASVDKSIMPIQGEKITAEQIAKIQSELIRTGVSLATILATAKVDSIEKMSSTTAYSIINKLAKSHDKDAK